MNTRYKVGDVVTVQALDGSTAPVRVEAIEVDEKGRAHVKLAAPAPVGLVTLVGESFARSVVPEGTTQSGNQLVERLEQPGASLWRNQLVQVYDRGTNRKVDTGNITALSRKHVSVNGVDYAFAQYSVLALG